jgi:uncharacterized membrane protein YidH (DUF202 family)
MLKLKQHLVKFGTATRDVYFKAGVAIGVALQSAPAAFATGSGTPHIDGPTQTMTSNTSPVAFGIGSVVVFLAAGVALFFDNKRSDQLGKRARNFLYVVMSISLLVCIISIYSLVTRNPG